MSMMWAVRNINYRQTINKLSILTSNGSFNMMKTVHTHSAMHCACFKFPISGNKRTNFLKTYIQTRNLSSLNELPKKKEHGKNKGPISWKVLSFYMGIGIIAIIAVDYVKKEKQQKIDRDRKRELGKAAIGGKFDLIDHNGKPRSSEEFLGQWLLIYFGFTHCPDICPEEIEKMIQVADDLEKNSPKLPKIQTLFITVDPDRDNVETVAKYVKEFSPRLLGLTGNKDQIRQVTRAYRVYYSEGPKDEDNDYIVDHTIIMYLINPEGEFVDYYGQTKSAEQIENAISIQMKKFEKSNSKWF